MANRKIAYTLGRGRAYISDMSSTSGYMGEICFREFGPRFFDMSSASGYMGAKYVQEFGPRFDMSSASGYMGEKKKKSGIWSQIFGHVLLPKRVTFTKGGGFLLSDGSSQGGL